MYVVRYSWVYILVETAIELILRMKLISICWLAGLSTLPMKTLKMALGAINAKFTISIHTGYPVNDETFNLHANDFPDVAVTKLTPVSK